MTHYNVFFPPLDPEIRIFAIAHMDKSLKCINIRKAGLSNQLNVSVNVSIIMFPIFSLLPHKKEDF